MTSTDTYTTAAERAREATEKSVVSWQQGTKTLTDQADFFAHLPAIDLVEPVERYFEFLKRSIDLNHDLATRWAELLNSLTGVVRDQAERVSTIVKEQTDSVAELAIDQAKKGEQVAKEQVELAEEAEKEQARLVRQAEREAASAARAKAREPYEDLTKAELADQLADRGLPKSGTVEELIERLVSADSE